MGIDLSRVATSALQAALDDGRRRSSTTAG
jgi:hypothetical protein